MWSLVDCDSDFSYYQITSLLIILYTHYTVMIQRYLLVGLHKSGQQANSNYPKLQSAAFEEKAAM